MNELEKRATEIEKKRQAILVETGLSVKIGDTLAYLIHSEVQVAIVEEIEINETHIGSSVLVCRVIKGDGRYGNAWKVGNTIKKEVHEVVRYKDSYFILRDASYEEVAWDWSICGSERKNNVRFEIFPDDPFIISYDALRNDEMDWIKRMIVDRRNRYYNKYLDLIKPLYELYRLRKEDIDSEYHLLRLISGISGVTDETMILDAILWWKTKNKYKRPIGEDEAKAVRMIAEKVKRMIRGKDVAED